jgi:hypothetical protein
MAMLKRDNTRSNNAFLISLAIHIFVAIFAVGYPIGHYFQQRGSSISVDWVKNVPEPKLQRAQPKVPMEMKFDPNRDPDLKSKTKVVNTSPNKIEWVKKRSDRIVDRSVEINDCPKKDQLPDIMTAVSVRDSRSDISGLISTDEGPIDGRGLLGNQVRAKGDGSGLRSGVSVMGLDGDGDGLIGGGGGGGGSGILDPLGIIGFMGESGGKQKIVYCLDISASMGFGAKLATSVKAIKESIMQLGDSDRFNIVVFFSNVRTFKNDLVPASMDNIQKAARFLDSFTSRNIENNIGTDILAAMRFALSINPNIVVLVTDIQPTRGEVDEVKIAEEIKRININSTRIYGVGVEVWEPKPGGRLAKLLKLITEQNGGQMRLASSG